MNKIKTKLLSSFNSNNLFEDSYNTMLKDQSDLEKLTYSIEEIKSIGDQAELLILILPTQIDKQNENLLGFSL